MLGSLNLKLITASNYSDMDAHVFAVLLHPWIRSGGAGRVPTDHQAPAGDRENNAPVVCCRPSTRAVRSAVVVLKNQRADQGSRCRASTSRPSCAVAGRPRPTLRRAHRPGLELAHEAVCARAVCDVTCIALLCRQQRRYREQHALRESRGLEQGPPIHAWERVGFFTAGRKDVAMR
jgi:hypothetical protein